MIADTALCFLYAAFYQKHGGGGGVYEHANNAAVCHKDFR